MPGMTTSRDQHPAPPAGLNRRGFITHLAAATSALLLNNCGTQTGRRKPNIVFFLADDLGAVDLGCYGSAFHETPNIDRLAGAGMKFTNAYAACPVCSPTRASIMTGNYPVRSGITNFIGGRHRLPHSRLIAVENESQLPLEAVTIAEALKTEGYRTASIGKWHLGGDGFTGDKQGFDLFVTRGTRKDGNWTGSPGLEGEDGEYMTDRFTKTAVKFIRDNKDDPFFLYFPYHNPHIPLIAKPEDTEIFAGKVRDDALQKHPVYAGMIKSIDDSVGAVMAELQQQGLTDNTLVVFFSDNGGLHVPEWNCEVPTSNSPFRAGKGHLYEGGIREPLIAHWPGVIAPGSQCDTPVTSTDFYPTLVEAAGVTNDPGDPRDGVSLMPLLRQSGGIERDAIYWHYPHYSNQTGKPGSAIREGDHKLIEFYEDNHLELYNLSSDPGEKQDLAGQMPDRARQLHEKLVAWREQTGAKMPSINPDYDQAREWEGLPWVQKCLGEVRR